MGLLQAFLLGAIVLQAATCVDIHDDMSGILQQDIEVTHDLSEPIAAHSLHQDLAKFTLHDPQQRPDVKAVLESQHGLDVYEETVHGVNMLQVFGSKHLEPAFADLGLNLIQTEWGLPMDKEWAKEQGYHNRAELKTAFDALQAAHPSLAKVIDLTARYDLPKTIAGNHIYAIKISDNVEQDEEEHNVLLVSNHHAREIATPELALYFAQQLLNGYETDSVIKQVVDAQQIFIIWTLNPDGLDIVWNSNRWNRVNARGVDLNRNYPIGFSAACGGSPAQGSETYRGTAPFSEVETQTMREFQKEMNFAKLLDFHSFSEEVRHGYASCGQLDEHVQGVFKDISAVLALEMGYQEAASCCLGGDISFAYAMHGSPPILVETSNSFQPEKQELVRTLRVVWKGVLKFLQMPLPVSGKVTDQAGNALSDVEIVLPDYTFTYGEKKPVRSNGLFHVWAPIGELKIQAKNGVTVKEETVSVKQIGVGTVLNIEVQVEQS